MEALRALRAGDAVMFRRHVGEGRESGFRVGAGRCGAMTVRAGSVSRLFDTPGYRVRQGAPTGDVFAYCFAGTPCAMLPQVVCFAFRAGNVKFLLRMEKSYAAY